MVPEVCGPVVPEVRGTVVSVTPLVGAAVVQSTVAVDVSCCVMPEVPLFSGPIDVEDIN